MSITARAEKYIDRETENILSSLKKKSVEKGLCRILKTNIGDDIGLEDLRLWKKGKKDYYYMIGRTNSGNGLGARVPSDHPHITRTKSEFIVRYTEKGHTDIDYDLGTSDHYITFSIGHHGEYILSADLKRNPRLEKKQRDVLREVGWLVTGALEEETIAHKDSMYRKGMKKTLKEARRIQRSTIPDRNPELEGFDIDGGVRWKYEVGGDYYDFLKIGDKVRLAIADVAGKGITAANIASSIHTAFHMNTDRKLKEFAERLNSYINEHYFRKTNKFATGVFGDLKVSGKKGKLRYVNAGHQYPILFSDKGTEEIMDNDLAMGFMKGTRYMERNVELDKGSGLLLYTDGVADASKDDDVMYEERLKEAIMDYRKLPAGEMGKKIIEEIRSDYRHNRDDKTWVVLKNLY